MNSKGAVADRPREAIGDSLYGEIYDKILGKVVFVEEIGRASSNKTSTKTSTKTSCNDSRKDFCNKVLVLCDHACYRVPPMLGYVSPKILLDHHGWDIGALSVARFLAQKLSSELSSPLIYSNFSRLLIDPNRGESAKDLIREDLSIPLNAGMDAGRRAERIALFYEPYHMEIDNFLNSSSSITFIISVHTFTPILRGESRVWDSGLIYDVERSGDVLCAEFMMSFLRSEGLLVGDNQPYPPLSGDSLARHATSRDIVGVGIEIRNNLVMDTRGQKEWGERLARGVQGWLSGLAERQSRAMI